MRQDLRVLTPARITSLAVQGVARVVRQHPAKVSLNFLGLFLLFFVQGFTPSHETYMLSDSLMPREDAVTAEREARFEVARAREAFHASRGLFWSCSTPACVANRAAFNRAEAAWIVHRDAQADAVARAKQALGLFSVEGVAETRELFWRTFSGGTAYAKRATVWDAFFVGMRSMGREEGLMSFVLEMISRFLMNLIAGIFSGIITFFFSVWTIISSYRPGWVGALAFFALCVVTGVSFFVSTLVVLGATVTAAVVGVVAALPAIGDAPRRQQGRPRRDS